MKKLIAALLFSACALTACNSSSSSPCTPSDMALTITSFGPDPMVSPTYYLVNGVRQEKLCLVRGTDYTLTFQNATFHPFVFTKDSHGGAAAGADGTELTSDDLPGYVANGACMSPCSTT